MNTEEVKKSVGVYFITPDGSVLLPVRAETEIKDGVEKKQFNPGTHQPTFNGKFKKGESLDDAIKRECEEELGKSFFKVLSLSMLNNFSEKKYEYKKEEYKSYGFWGRISEEDVKKIKLHSGALPNLVRVKHEDLKKIGNKDSKREIRMFNDQYEELKELFKILKRKKIV